MSPFSAKMTERPSVLPSFSNRRRRGCRRAYIFRWGICIGGLFGTRGRKTRRHGDAETGRRGDEEISVPVSPRLRVSASSLPASPRLPLALLGHHELFH